ncbi:MAG: amidohydrolase family protein, partial [Xanthobacteraceae bacterium]
MLIDFQQHYTPPELLKGDPTKATVDLDRDGNPSYLLNPLLADLNAHVAMMDASGIDAGVLTCGSGFDQPDLAICRQINDRMRQAEQSHPGRFIGLAHVPALKPDEAAVELKRCAVELGFPGVVIGSELKDQQLDAEALRPFWKVCADLNLYVFIHPLPRVIGWARMNADDLGRMLGWEFSLMTAAVRIVNSGLLDELPNLRIQFSHFAGGIGRYLGRVRGFQQRGKWGTAQVPRHGRQPRRPFDYYLDQRLYYDIAGWAGPDHAAEWGADWVRFGLD